MGRGVGTGINYMCMSHRWWGGGFAVCAVGGWVGDCGSIFCVLLRHCIIFCVPLNPNSPTHTYSVLFTVFVLCLCYCKGWGSCNALCILCRDLKHEGLKMIQYNRNM